MNYFLIDALNLVHRAHNANFELKTGAGLYSGMFYGFIRTIFALKKKYRGYKIEVVWDRKPEFKKALQSDYKAGRTSLSETVMGQIPDIQAFLRNAGVDQYFMEGQEADDVLASLAVKYSAEDGTVMLYSNDKDLLQLVKNGKIIVFKPKVGLNPEKFYDEQAVKEQFGVPPEKLACYRSFDGDPGDNITGVSRVPRKILANLVNSFETVKGVYDNLLEVKLTEFQLGSMIEGKERVATNFKITELNRSLDSIVCDSSSFDKKNISELFGKYEIRSINPDNIIDIFSSSLNIRYSDPRAAVKVESFSLFD